MEEIRQFLDNYSERGRARALLSRPDFMDRLREIYPDMDDDREIVFLFISGKPRPSCNNCGSRVSFFGNRHAKTCSRACDVATRSSEYKRRNAERLRETAKDQKTKDKRHLTNVSRYGSGQSPNVRKAARERSNHLNKKGRETLLDRYGVSSPVMAPGALDRARATRLANSETNDRKSLVRQHIHYDEMCSETETIIDVCPPVAKEANFRLTLECGECSNVFTCPTETFKFRMRKTGKSCPKCCGLTTSTSLDEKELAKYVETLGVTILENSREIISPSEIDVFVPSANLAIEYCGIYWHSELAGKDRMYHRNKLDQCEIAGVRLLTVFEDEWLTKRPIVEAMISNTLGKNAIRIMARKCSVRKISNRIGLDFIRDNHIQACGRAKHYYGLFHNDDLVSVMSFSNSELSRRSSGWDINRFCSKLGTNVMGGAGKLFKAFLRDHDPDRVVSYADLRYGTGDVYGQIGFVKEGLTVPNYWYFRNGEMERKHRFGLRKSADDDQSISEWENRKKQGWNRIWDCGHAKWVWSK